MPGWQQRQVVRALRAGGIIAYPTEAVWGLGCDPLNLDTLHRLLSLKHRPARKGLILIAAHFSDLEPFLAPLSPGSYRRVMESWPGPVTWLLPALSWVPVELRGAHDSLAVRVTAHAETRALCEAFGGALVSTSANRSGHPPARSALRARRYFHRQLAALLPGETGGASAPSEIRDARSGKLIRPA